MAAHPDQLFIDGEPQRQVESRSQVTPGTFYLDEASSRLYLGSDPTGRTVEASVLVKALSVRGPHSTIRGIGIRRYSPSVFHLGAVTLEAPRAHLENVVVQDAATTGVSVLNTDSILARVTVGGAGMLGIHARFADRILIHRVLSTWNNDELFNIAPVSGGAKLTQVRGVTVRNSNFSGNYGHGFWADESVYDTVVRQSSFNGNVASGLFFEISANVVVGDNQFANNVQDGIRVNNTSHVEIWNNTFVGNGRSVNLLQDDRRNTDPENPAADPRVPFPDPEMPWTLGPVTVHNNVISAPNASADCLLCVEDYSFTATGEEMEITADGDVYHRADAASPAWLAIWSRGSADRNPHVVPSVEALRSVTGQELSGREYVGAPILDSDLALVSHVSQEASSVARRLPADIAAKIGRPTGACALGAW